MPTEDALRTIARGMQCAALRWDCLGQSLVEEARNLYGARNWPKNIITAVACVQGEATILRSQAQKWALESERSKYRG